MNIKPWIKAARLRTLPLAFSSIIVGTALALKSDAFNVGILIFALLTTLLLQVLSNFANDYGDAVSGKDNEQRIGPDRMVSKGIIKPNQMKKVMFFTAILAFISGVELLFFAFGFNIVLLSIFMVIGIASIFAAINYTVGKNPYGYIGLGDLFVFIFFGLVGVKGTYFLYTQQLDLLMFLPAISIGLLSAAVLNFNNMRDIENDKATGKNTLVVKIGLQSAKTYQGFIVISSILLLIIYSLLNNFSTHQYLYLLIAPYFMHIVKQMLKVNQPVLMDPFLKKTAISTFILSILFLISVTI